jgi:hypothetical protein
MTYQQTKAAINSNMLGIETMRALQNNIEIYENYKTVEAQGKVSEERSIESKQASEITQKQLDEAVKSGKPIEEVQQAHVNGVTGEVYPLLVNRMDAEYEEIKDNTEKSQALENQVGRSDDLGVNPQTLSRSLSDRKVNLKDFGAIGDGKHHKLSEFFPTLETAQMRYPTAQSLDDSIDLVAAETARDYLTKRGGGVLLSPAGTYMFNRTYNQTRLVGLEGVGMIETIWKLSDGANCPLFKDPQSTQTGKNHHYCYIKSMGFNGNMEKQTEEVELVVFSGAWIGSYLDDVTINNFYGCGLSLGNVGADLKLSHVWVWYGYTTSNRYAVEINNKVTSGQNGYLNGDHIYVEHYYKNVLPNDPNKTVKDRATPIWANRLVSLNINELHFEYIRTGIDFTGCQLININNTGVYGIGNGVDVDACVFKFRDANCFAVRIGTGVMGSIEGNVVWVRKEQNVTSNWLIDEKTKHPIHVNYSVTNPDAFQDDQNNYFNRMFVFQLLELYKGDFRLSNDAGSHFFKMDNQKFKFGSNINQASDKDFMIINSYGHSGDNVQYIDPLLLPERSVDNNIANGSIYTRNGNLRYKTNGQGRNVTTAIVGAGAPTINADTEGQLYIDTVGDRAVYASIRVGTGATDWQKL